MRIGIFTECYKPLLNGVVNSVIGFKEGLTKLGHDVYIFCPTYTDTKPNDKKVIYCKSWQLPGKSGYHYIFPLEKKVLNIAKTMDIIHVQHPFIMGDIASKTAKKFNIPIAFTNHTQYDQYLHYIPFSKKFVKKQLIEYIKKFTQKVDLIIAPAPGIQRKLESYRIKTPIFIVPNGIEVKRFEQKSNLNKINSLRKKYDIKSSDRVLVFTGRIAEEKNLSFLINSFEKINKKIPNTKLLLVGGGVEIDKFNQLINKKNLSTKAIITDFIPYEDMPDYLNLATIYVTASKSEVHPLTILEGLAAGLPIVIVKAPGTGDIVTNNKEGLVSKDNINGYAQKVIKVLENKKLHQKLSITAKKTAQQYSILETSRTMLKAYEKTIKIHQNK